MNNYRDDKGFVFPELGYSYDALEPYIDARTMEFHYTKHHRGYFDKFVAAINDSPLEKMELEDIFAEISQHSGVVRNNGGGFFNHNLFWEVMSPSGKENESLQIHQDIEKQFGSMDSFKDLFSQAAASRFGSGWAWLFVDETGKLKIGSTANQDNPLMDVSEIRGMPVLGLDVWEHAYYLKYQNRRPDYITAFWSVVNWKVVNEKYKSALSR